MKSHITESEAKRMFAEQTGDIIKRTAQNNFALGAHAISKMVLKDYIPDIENATTDEERTKAIEALKHFLGNGENLKTEEAAE